MWTKQSSFFVGVPHIYTHWHFLKNCISQDRISYAAVTTLPWTFLLNTQRSYLTYTKLSESWVTLQSSFFSTGSLGNQSAFNLHNIGHPYFHFSRKSFCPGITMTSASFDPKMFMWVHHHLVILEVHWLPGHCSRREWNQSLMYQFCSYMFWLMLFPLTTHWGHRASSNCREARTCVVRLNHGYLISVRNPSKWQISLSQQPY